MLQSLRLHKTIVSVIAGTLALLTVVAILQLNKLADENRAVVATLAGIEARAQQINALEWQAIAEKKITSEAVQKLVEVRSQLLATVKGLQGNYADAVVLDHFYALYGTYVTALDEEIAALQAGDFALAQEVDEERVDPGFEALLEVIGEARNRYEDLAQSKVRWAERWILLVVAVSTLAFLALFWVYARTRNREAVALAQQEVLRASEERFRALTENSTDLIAIVDPGCVVRYVSSAAAKVFGYREDVLVGANMFDVVHPDDAPMLRNSLKKQHFEGHAQTVEFRVRKADGTWAYAESGIRHLLANPIIAGFVLNVRDISERKEAEKQLFYNAFHDVLTQLPNRALFLDRVEAAVHRAQRHPPVMVTVFFIDIDDFKTVNDSLGHDAGDQLILWVSARLKHSLRAADTVGRADDPGGPANSVARMGGDEFTVLLEDIKDPADALRIAERIQSAISVPLALCGQDVFKTASIGIAFSAGQIDSEKLIRNADIAMYRAKKLGGARSEIFDTAMHAQVLQRLKLEAELRHALEQEEFRLHYQPIVSMQTGQVTGLEALLRWQRPGVGLVYPLDFLPVAEETGLIRVIGKWVLREACTQCAGWQRAIPRERPISISVNIANKQFNSPGFVESVAETLRATGIDPTMVHLEITETVAMEDAERTREMLAQLKALGVKLSLDDFGTGYSSLNYLRRFGVDSLKLDRSFISHLDDNQENQAIVSTIMALARALRIDVVAEGLERIEEMDELVRAGCVLAQGYYFSRPVDADKVAGLLAKGVQNPSM